MVKYLQFVVMKNHEEMQLPMRKVNFRVSGRREARADREQSHG